MWVADMEFAVVPEIVDAMRQRLGRRIFGYTGVFTHDYYNSFSKWCKDHYDWSFPEEKLASAPASSRHCTSSLRRSAPRMKRS